MALTNSLELSRWMLFSMGIRIRLQGPERLPRSPFLMIANHRSFLDAPLLIAAAARPVHFACHHYMSQVPVMSQIVEALGCFPLDGPAERGRTFFKQASGYLRSQQSIGVFPEGTNPMVTPTAPGEISSFHRGFAHLALRAPIDDLQLIPTAIIALEEKHQDTIPFRLLSWFDPSEPLFHQSGRHPAIIYRQVAVIIGNPIAVTDPMRQAYYGKQASQVATELTETCQDTVQQLLQKGCY
ncbi:MAG: lysophospholipid acyltransferase family protein [Cyanobacteria bacterium J06623_4]